jgi:hypothetical protein
MSHTINLQTGESDFLIGEQRGLGGIDACITASRKT